MNVKYLCTLSYYQHNGVTLSFDWRDTCSLIFIGLTCGYEIRDSITIPNYLPIEYQMTSIIRSLTDNVSGCTIKIILDYSNRTITAQWINNGDNIDIYIRIWGIHAK